MINHPTYPKIIHVKCSQPFSLNTTQEDHYIYSFSLSTNSVMFIALNLSSSLLLTPVQVRRSRCQPSRQRRGGRRGSFAGSFAGPGRQMGGRHHPRVAFLSPPRVEGCDPWCFSLMCCFSFSAGGCSSIIQRMVSGRWMVKNCEEHHGVYKL